MGKSVGSSLYFSGEIGGSGLAIQQLVILMVLGQEPFLGPIRIDLFSPDKQLLHQLVPLGYFVSAS
jgi:hypothetical protein